MRRAILLSLAVSMLAVTGCDFFRRLAGRPTSEDIQNKKIQIELAQAAALQARQDSIRRVEQFRLDSLAALDSISHYGVRIYTPARLSGLAETQLESRYHVMVGVFRLRSNAEKLLSRTQAAGYQGSLISFGNGMFAVGVSPTSNIVDAREALKQVRTEKFCPADMWLLLNE